MMTVSEVSRRTGVSVRTLRHYDRIGLLKPACLTEAGYRMYDDSSLERLQYILLYRELQFPLRDILRMIDSPDFDRNRALDQQIALLELRREHLDNLILLARGMRGIGVRRLDFEVFNDGKFDECVARAKKSCENAPVQREIEERRKAFAPGQQEKIEREMLEILTGFGRLKDREPSDSAVRAQVEKLQAFITEHFCACTPELLACMGKMYGGGGSVTENIDLACGDGTAEFAAKAIEAWYESR